jgi:hypothetical protein
MIAMVVLKQTSNCLIDQYLNSLNPISVSQWLIAASRLRMNFLVVSCYALILPTSTFSSLIFLISLAIAG